MLNSLASEPPKEPVTVGAPDLQPRRKLVRKPVFLSKELWEALDECAKFHGEVFAHRGADEKVSRNDIISAFLTWAVQQYWADKGGKPTDAKDRAAKVKRHAEKQQKTADGE